MEKLIEDGIRIAQSDDNLQELNKDFAEEQQQFLSQLQSGQTQENLEKLQQL